tara:strand:+ start:537 stop:728 length:192 start_codon:yes stop_codon:yes gene_type:complete
MARKRRKYRGLWVPMQFPPTWDWHSCDTTGKFFYTVGFNTYIRKSPKGYFLVLDHPDTEAGAI